MAKNKRNNISLNRIPLTNVEGFVRGRLETAKGQSVLNKSYSCMGHAFAKAIA